MRTAIFLCSSLGAVAIASSSALAQTGSTPQADRNNEAAAGPEVQGESSTGIADIIVTAQKRTETAQSTPLSVGVVTGADLARKAQTNLASALRDVPSVEVQGLAQGAQLYIRGVGSSIDPGFADPSIALMVDGAYNGRTEAVTSGGYDIDRIEVLRGPQGTLYGRNASGGLVNVITANPATDKFGGYVRGQLGDYALRRIEGAVNAPLADTLAVRIAGYRETRHGYVDDGSSDSNSWGVRAKLLYQPTDWLRILAKADVYRESGKGQNTVPVPGSAGNLFFPPPYFVSNFDPTIQNGPPFAGGAPILRFPNGYVQRNAGDAWSNNPEHVAGYINRKAETYSAEVNADLGFASLTVLPTYTRFYNLLVSSFLFGSILPFQGPTYSINSNYTSQGGTTRYKSVETRLTSKGGGPFSYVLGFYYLGTTPGTPLAPTTSVTNTGQPLVFDTDFLPGSTIAGFGQLTYSLTSRFRVTGGIRYSRDKSAQSYAVTLGTAMPNYITYHNSQGATQYKVGLEYDLRARSLLYAHVSTGFKQGGISPTIPPVPFKPEHLTAFEIGSKNQFLNNRLQLNISAFHYIYRDYQFSSFQALRVGNADATANFAVIGNARRTNIDGAEIETQFVPWRGGKFTASLTYLDAKYGSAVLPNNPFVNQGNFDLKGRQIQNAPRWASNLAFEQGFMLAGGQLTAGAHSHLSSGYYVTPEQYLPGARQQHYTRTDLYLNYAFPHNHLTIGGWLKNIEGDAQTTYVFPAYRRFITAPRTFGFSAGYSF